MIVMISHLLTGPGNSRWVYSEGVWDSCQDCYGEGQVKLSQSFRILQVLGTKVLFMKWMFCLTYFKDLILVYSAFFVYDVLASQVSSWRAECKSKKKFTNMCSETIWMNKCELFTILSYLFTLFKTQMDCALPPYWLKIVISTGRPWRIQPVPDTAKAVVQWRDTGKQLGIHSLPHTILPLYFQYAWYPFHEFYLYSSIELGGVYIFLLNVCLIKKKDLDSFFRHDDSFGISYSRT